MVPMFFKVRQQCSVGYNLNVLQVGQQSSLGQGIKILQGRVSVFSRVGQQSYLGQVAMFSRVGRNVLQGMVAIFSRVGYHLTPEHGSTDPLGLGSNVLWVRVGQSRVAMVLRVRQQSSLGQGRVGQGSNGSLGLGSNTLYRRVAVFSRVVQQWLSGVGQHYCYLRQNSSYFQGYCSNDRVVLLSSKTDSLGYFSDDSPWQANSGCLRQRRNVLQCRIAMILQVEQQWLPRQDSNGSLCRIVIVLQVGQ